MNKQKNLGLEVGFLDKIFAFHSLLICQFFALIGQSDIHHMANKLVLSKATPDLSQYGVHNWFQTTNLVAQGYFGVRSKQDDNIEQNICNRLKLLNKTFDYEFKFENCRLDVQINV